MGQEFSTVRKEIKTEMAAGTEQRLTALHGPGRKKIWDMVGMKYRPRTQCSSRREKSERAVHVHSLAPHISD